MSGLEMPVAKQEIGGLVSDFQLNSVDGKSVALSSLLAGKRGAVVVFWSMVCSHCVLYDEYLSSFNKRHPNLGLTAIASRSGERAEEIRPVIAARKLAFPILHDPGSKIAGQWFTQQTPRAFLLDSDRHLLYRGAIDNYKYPDDPAHIPYLEPAIAEFLAGKPISRAETASFGCAIKSVYYNLPKAL